MGIGRRLGEQISQWVIADPQGIRNPQLLSNRLKDLLGPEADAIKGPLLDIVNQPQFHQTITCTGSNKVFAATELQKYIQKTYSHSISSELEIFLEAASDIPLKKNVTPTTRNGNETSFRTFIKQGWNLVGKRILRFGYKVVENLYPLAPGIALSASFALVFAWLGGELDRLEVVGLNMGSGFLIAFLGMFELLRFVPQKIHYSFSKWMINSSEVAITSNAWKWISHSFIHAKAGECVLNLLMLFIILGNTPLPLSEIFFRFNLTSLACLIGAAAYARNSGITKVWGGASGSVAALISLACCLSLFEVRSLNFDIGWISFPAWVLFIVNSSLHLTWQQKQKKQNKDKKFVQIVLSTPFAWGSILGGFWSIITILQKTIP